MLNVYKDIVPTTLLMKSFLFTAAILFLIVQKKCMNQNRDNTPACVQKTIDSLQKLPPFNPRAEVSEYLYKGKRVFHFSADCCDKYTTLIDMNCNYICAPGGGITGKGDGTCLDFKDAERVRVVWRDERK